MAKYEDYVRKEQSIESEINEAAESSASREAQIPEQFQGKSAEEIARSYQELESLNSRQANELGELRRTNSVLNEQMSRNSHQEAPAPTPEPITVDDLYTDPAGTIARTVEEQVSGKLKALEEATQRIELKENMTDLESKYPGFRDTAKSSEMQDWIKESGYRQRLATAADQGDFQAAEDLLGMYYDLNGKKVEREKVPNEARKATLESGTSDVHSPVEKFSRSKLELARRRAKLGDLEAEQYLKENGDAIFRAYEEGRIVN